MSTIDCSKPQTVPTDPPTRSPERSAQQQPVPTPVDNGVATQEGKDINNEGEDWGSNEAQQIDNDGEDWSNIDNEGEDWGSSGVNNDGEDWSQPKPTGKPTTGKPTNVPTPRVPTPDPTPEPTIDLMDHLENLKTSYFCSESWDNIDCANAQACPSGDSKGKSFFLCP